VNNVQLAVFPAANAEQEAKDIALHAIRTTRVSERAPLLQPPRDGRTCLRLCSSLKYLYAPMF
jgi:hypothetical protein